MDPAKRKQTPEFYGYIPDGGSRTVMFGCMILNSALLLLVRSLSAAMMLMAKKRYFALLMAGDMALYLLQKVARGDFHYWAPFDGAFGVFLSLLLRVFIKTITDFTGVIHFRHPYELGGLYWTANMFLALLASFVCAWVGEGGRELWTLVVAASGAWVLTFALILMLMKKEYRGTFFSTVRGKDQTMNFFLKGGDDEMKSEVIVTNEKHWVEIRPLMEEWVKSNWWRWKAEHPAWFTRAWISKVPIEWMPSDEEVAQKKNIVRRRRNSVSDSMKLLVGIVVDRQAAVRPVAK